VPNLCNKIRKVDNPYEVWTTPEGSWTWYVLRKYQTPENEKKNPYAIWFCAVKSPLTHGAFEYGDTYCQEIQAVATKVR
jgi:hypothetical protein